MLLSHKDSRSADRAFYGLRFSSQIWDLGELQEGSAARSARSDSLPGSGRPIPYSSGPNFTDPAQDLLMGIFYGEFTRHNAKTL